VPGHKSHEPAIDDDGLIRLSPDEDIILGYNNAHPGYQHWLTQCLPAFDWSLRQQRTRPVRLLMPALQPWQQDFLRISAGEITDEPPPAQVVRHGVPGAKPGNHSGESQAGADPPSFGVWRISACGLPARAKPAPLTVPASD
jgi:hypothetical protein